MSKMLEGRTNKEILLFQHTLYIVANNKLSAHKKAFLCFTPCVSCYTTMVILGHIKDSNGPNKLLACLLLLLLDNKSLGGEMKNIQITISGKYNVLFVSSRKFFFI